MINVAIIGTGNISAAHIAGYLEFPDRCKIVALVDIYPEKAYAKNKEYGLNADVYDDHKKLFERDDIDLVSVCTPPYTHAEITINLLKHNSDVICEKPMASSLAECDAMIATAKETGKRLSSIAQNRFRTPIMNLKKTLDSNLAGKVMHTQVDSFWWRGHSYYDLWWRGTWEKEGGGCTLNHAVHHIDMLNWMMGKPQEVTAILANLNHDNSEVEDFSVAITKYESGSLATVTSSLVHHGEEQKLVFQCEKAKISAPWDCVASTSKPNGFGEPDESVKNEIDAYYHALPALPYEGHTAQIDNVLTAIEQQVDFMIHGQDGRNTVELITAIYKAGFTHKTVALPIAQSDPWYTTDGIMKNVEKFYEKGVSIENFDADEITLGGSYSK